MHRIKITVQLPGAIRQDHATGVFVSVCPALNLYSQGESKKEAMEAIESTVALFLETCLENGMLDEALTKLGFRRRPGHVTLTSPRELAEPYIAIEKISEDYEAFDMDVPIELVAAQQAASCQP